MARRKIDQSNALIDWVRPTDSDGPLVGAAFSTYGMSPEFFGQDFLPTLLGLGGVRARGFATPVTMDRTLATSDVSLVCDAHAMVPEPDGELRFHLRALVTIPLRILFPESDGGRDVIVAITPEPDPKLALTASQVRSVLAHRVVRIVWGEPSATTPFPVNVLHESKAAMPSVLGAKPSEEQLLAYFHGRISDEDLIAKLEQQARDTERPMDCTTMADCERLRQLQSYVVREFVESLYGLSRMVREASFSPRAAEQALLGDLSPLSLAEQVLQALCAARRSPTAAAFQFAELIRLVGELTWPASTKQEIAVGAALDQVRIRALDRLFTIVRQAAARPEFVAVLKDREFAAYVQLLLPTALAQRWLGLVPPEALAASLVSTGVGA